jgi:HSP20 family molecular chaperone IbpA
MNADIIQSMHDQVRAIYRAVTGEEVAEADASSVGEESDEEITRRFAELEAITRASAVSTRVPPFMFTPRVDVIAADGGVLIEVELPGLDRDAISVERRPSSLVISGIRRDGHAARGNMFHAEIPRGPFTRTIPLPFRLEAEPRIELDRGVLRIHLTVATRSHGREGNNRDDKTKTKGGK